MQKWGDSYWETYSTVVNMLSFLLILAIKKIHKLESKAIDFVLAFPFMDFCNCQYQTDAEHIYYGRICLPISIAPFLHTAVCTETRFMFEQLAVWLTFSFKGPYLFDCFCFVGKSVAVDDWSVASSLVVRYFLFRSINERHFVFLFHCISKRESFIGGYVGGIHKMMYFVEGTVVQLIQFVKPIHNLLGIG